MATIAEKWIDQGIEKGIEKDIEKGVEKGKWDVVKNLLCEGLSIDFIAKITGFPTEKVKQFKESIQGQQRAVPCH